MPYSEKYANVLDFARLTDTFVLPLVEKHLGDEGVTEVQRIWEERLEPVPEDASFEKKYETAYRNWIWKWAEAVNFMRNKLGENGVEEFKRAAVDALKRKSSVPPAPTMPSSASLLSLYVLSPPTSSSMVSS